MSQPCEDDRRTSARRNVVGACLHLIDASYFAAGDHARINAASEQLELAARNLTRAVDAAATKPADWRR